MYQLTITKDGTQVESAILTEELFTKVKKAIEVKPKKEKKPKPLFKDLGKDDFETDIYDEEGELDLDLVAFPIISKRKILN